MTSSSSSAAIASEAKTYDVITINQLFEKLPESELKAIQVYFDKYYPCKFNKKRYLCKVLKISLVYNDRFKIYMSDNKIQKCRYYRQITI